MDTKIIISGVLAAIAVLPVAILLGEKTTTPASVSEQVVALDSSDNNADASPDDQLNEKEAAGKESQAASSVEIADSTVSSASLIDSFTLVAPTDSKSCGTRDPWGQGVKTLGDQDQLSASDCFALRVSVLEDVEVFMFSHAENGTLIRLFSSSCNALGPVNSRVHSGEEIQLPQDNGGNHLVIGLDEQSGKEWFYAVAINSEQASEKFNSAIAGIPDVCQEGEKHMVPVAEFKSILDNLQKQPGGGLQWQARSFLHI